MDLIERSILLLVGGWFGYVLGYIHASLGQLEQKVDNMSKDEKGFMRHPIVADVMLLSVLAIVVFAAFRSQAASNEVEAQQEVITENQSLIERITYCNQYFLVETIADLNERTTYTVAQANSNVELQKAQSKFLAIVLSDPPKSEEIRRQALELYFDNLTEFVVVATKSTTKIVDNPFATEDQVANCFDGTQIPEPEETR